MHGMGGLEPISLPIQVLLGCLKEKKRKTWIHMHFFFSVSPCKAKCDLGSQTDTSTCQNPSPHTGLHLLVANGGVIPPLGASFGRNWTLKCPIRKIRSR